MSCPDPSALAAYAARRLSSEEASGIETHLADCPDCLQDLRDLPAPRRVSRWPLAVAASLLAAVGLATLWKRGPEAPKSAPSVERRKQASLEVEPGGDASLVGKVLTLRSGACWLDTEIPVELADPRVRFAAGTEAEVRILGPRKLSLMTEAWAAEPAVLVSVVSGSAEAGGIRIPAGSRMRIPGGRLEPLNPAPIFAWRLGRIETGSRGPERTLANGSVSFPGPFSVEVRAVRGQIVLRYPAGETTLGDLALWRDASWHRLSVRWKGTATEVFLDGKRILKLPGSDGRGTPGLAVPGGSLVFREIRP